MKQKGRHPRSNYNFIFSQQLGELFCFVGFLFVFFCPFFRLMIWNFSVTCFHRFQGCFSQNIILPSSDWFWADSRFSADGWWIWQTASAESLGTRKKREAKSCLVTRFLLWRNVISWRKFSLEIWILFFPPHTLIFEAFHSDISFLFQTVFWYHILKSLKRGHCAV